MCACVCVCVCVHLLHTILLQIIIWHDQEQITAHIEDILKLEYDIERSRMGDFFLSKQLIQAKS